MNTAPRNRAMTASVLTLVLTALASFPVWGEWHTRLVKDMNPGIGNSVVFKSVNAGTLTYFISGNAYTGDYKLNCTDGTAANTYELSPMGRSQSWTTPDRPPLVSLNGGVIFARNFTGALQLCRSHGMPAVTTELVYLGDPDDFLNKVGNFIAVGEQVFFTKGSGLLYRSDGTTSGTTLVKDFSADGGMSLGSKFCGRNGMLYFSVSNAGGGLDGLWRSDGTPGGTTRFWQPGTDYSAITGLWNTPDGLYVAAIDEFPAIIRELWRITPESDGAQRVYSLNNVNGGVNSLVWLSGQAYFGVLQAQQLWKTGGGSQAVMVAEIPPPSGLTYTPSIGGLAATDRALVFSAQTAAAGDELWTSDGTTGGTRLLKDFTAGPQSSEFVFVPLDGGDLFMWVKDSVAGNWPFWKTDGTDAGTTQALLYQYAMEPQAVCKVGADYLLPYSAPATGMEPYLLTEGSFAITQQPRPLGMAEVDSTVRFTVEVPEWARPWTQYQWLLDGAPVTGAIAPDLVIPAVQYTDAGLYSCRVVFNDGGGDTTLVSSAARLTVVESVPVLNVPMSAVLALLLCAVAGVLVARRENHRAPSTKA